MNLFFFTIADAKRKAEAENILIASGRYYGREIHLFDIPEGEKWYRYRERLFLSSELPKADKYIYLDSDTIMTCAGDWESEECQGVADVFYFCPELRKKGTMGFLRPLKTFGYIHDLWVKFGWPIWCNAGVVVLSADARINFMTCWRKWSELIDEHCPDGFFGGTETPLMFARHFFDLPILPPRFHGLLKSQPIYDWHVLLHDAANPPAARRVPYLNAIKKIRENKDL